MQRPAKRIRIEAAHPEEKKSDNKTYNESICLTPSLTFKEPAFYSVQTLPEGQVFLYQAMWEGGCKNIYLNENKIAAFIKDDRTDDTDNTVEYCGSNNQFLIFINYDLNEIYRIDWKNWKEEKDNNNHIEFPIALGHFSEFKKIIILNNKYLIAIHKADLELLDINTIEQLDLRFLKEPTLTGYVRDVDWATSRGMNHFAQLTPSEDIQAAVFSPVNEEKFFLLGNKIWQQWNIIDKKLKLARTIPINADSAHALTITADGKMLITAHTTDTESQLHFWSTSDTTNPLMSTQSLPDLKPESMLATSCGKFLLLLCVTEYIPKVLLCDISDIKNIRIINEETSAIAPHFLMAPNRVIGNVRSKLYLTEDWHILTSTGLLIDFPEIRAAYLAKVEAHRKEIREYLSVDGVDQLVTDFLFFKSPRIQRASKMDCDDDNSPRLGLQ